MVLREKITLRQSTRVAFLFSESLEKNIVEIIQTIAVNDDGTEIKDILDVPEEEIYEIFGSYIAKKNSLKKNFADKMKDSITP